MIEDVNPFQSPSEEVGPEPDMRDPTPKCLRCSSEMQQGYIPDRNAGYDPSKWFEGELVRVALGGVKKSTSKPLLVHTYRCVQCGYLESYAITPAS